MSDDVDTLADVATDLSAAPSVALRVALARILAATARADESRLRDEVTSALAPIINAAMLPPLDDHAFWSQIEVS